MQIGANTMDNPNDPFLVHLGKYNHHRKVFMEPIPAYFQKLKQNLASMPNTTFINVAISSTQGGVCSPRHKLFWRVKLVAALQCAESVLFSLRTLACR